MRATRVFLLVAMVSTSLALGYGSAGAVTAGPRFMYSGHGYALLVSGGGVSPTKVTNEVMWCRTKPGIHDSNSLASTSVPGVLSTGTVSSASDGTLLAQGAGKKAVTTTDVQNLSLLGGLISAQELKAVSTTVHTATGFASSDAGGVWGSLSIAGQTLPNQVPAPNTRIDIPLVGYVVMNEQQHVQTPTAAVLTINMLHIHVTLDNPLLGIKNGLNIVVGHALSGLVEVAGPLGGTAFTSSLNGAGLLSSGPTAVMYLPCAGTDGQTRQNNFGGVGLPGVIGVGTGHNIGSGVVRPDFVRGNVESSAQDVRLLGGMVTADAVDAHVRAVRQNGHRVFRDVSGGFTNLVVNGQAVSGNAPANTQIPLPGIGTVWVHRVQRTAEGLRVTMLEITVGSTNGLGLPAGADLKLVSAWIAIF